MRQLPNVLVVVLFFIFFIFLIDSDLINFSRHFLTALVTFVITSIFFALRWIAGGDVKLWTVVMFWAGPHLSLPVVIITTLSGGVLGILGWLAALRLRRNPDTFGRSVLRLISSDRGVPYGVALSIAGLYVIYTYASALIRLN